MQRTFNLAFARLCLTLFASLAFTSIFEKSAFSDEVPETLPAPPLQDEQISLEDGQIIKDLQAWLKTLQNIGADKTKPKASEESEYLRNWIETTQTNIERLSKRRSVSRKKMMEYSQQIREDYINLGRYISLKDVLNSWEKAKTSSPVEGHWAEDRRQKNVDEQNQLFALNGVDPYELFEKIAHESRPKPIELDDVELILVFKTPKTNPDPDKPDYWAKTDKPIIVELTNQGGDASTYTWTMFDTRTGGKSSDNFIDDVFSPSMSCGKTGEAGARCDTTSLEAGETKTIRMKTFVPEYSLDDLDSEHRIQIRLVARAESESPPAEAEEVELKLSYRHCVTDYRKKLLEAGRYLKSADAVRKYNRAIRPIPELKGKSLFKYKDSFLDRIGIPNKGHYIREAIKHRGPDRFLMELHTEMNPRHPLVYGRSLHQRMYDESIPKEMCARPSPEIERIRALLGVQKAFVDEFADALSAAARKREQGFKESMSEGVGGDALKESAKSFATDRAFDGAGYAAEKFSLWLGDTATAAKNASKTVGILSFINSLYSIAQSAVALNSAIPEEVHLERTLGMMEAAAYMDGLKKRYADLYEVYRTYLKMVEDAYSGSCTCRDPF